MRRGVAACTREHATWTSERRGMVVVGSAAGRQLREKARRTESGQAHALASQVRLIHVAGRKCAFRQPVRLERPAVDQRHERLKPQDALQLLRPTAEGIVAAAPELAFRQKQVAANLLDRTAAPRLQAFDDIADAPARWRRIRTAEELAREQRERAFRRSRLCEQFPEARVDRSTRVGEADVPVGDLAPGESKECRGSPGGEAGADHRLARGHAPAARLRLRPGDVDCARAEIADDLGASVRNAQLAVLPTSGGDLLDPKAREIWGEGRRRRELAITLARHLTRR